MKLTIDLPHSSYDIIIQKGLLSNLSKEISEVFKGKKIFILTDKNVDNFYGDKVLKELSDFGYDTNKLVLEPGEETK